MLGELNYTKKCYLLIIGLICFLFIAYNYSFVDTINLKAEIQEKEEKLTWLKEKEKEIPFLKSKMNEFDKNYSNGDSSSVRDRLTAYISEFAEKNSCLVIEIPGNAMFKNDQLKVLTNTFTIRGSYKELVKLLYNLEYEQKYIAKIMSANFYSVKDLQSKKVNLFLTIITQSFEQKKS
jgi:hypothetical protein